jgi:hypothetical protein
MPVALLESLMMFARTEPARPRPRPSDRPNPGPWLALFSASFAVRVASALFVMRGETWASAFPAWRAVAIELARGAGFVTHGAAGMMPTAAVPPLAPWLVSSAFRASLPQPLALAIVVALLGALAPLVISALGMAVFGGGVGRWAGWICALDPFLVWGPPPVEAVAAVVLAITLLATAAWIKTPRPGRAFGVGVLWGAGALAHPALLLLACVVTAWAWVPLGLTVTPRDRIRQMLLVFLGLTAVLLPWTLRNARVVHGFVPVNTGNGVALLAGSSHRAWSDRALRGAPEPVAELIAEHPELATGEVAADRYAFDLAAAHLRDHASEAAPVIVTRVLGFATGPLAPLELPLTLPLAVGAWLMLPFALWGAFRATTGPRRLFQSLAVLVVLYFFARALIYGAGASARVPVEPVIALLAAVGADDVRRRLRARAHGLTVIPGRR